MLLSALTYEPIVRIGIGALKVSPHGVFTAVGCLVGAWFFRRETRARGVDDELIISMLTRAAIAAIVGARLVYVLNHLDQYGSVLDWFKVWEGGISLPGGLTGGVLAAWWSCRRDGLDFIGLADVAAPWLPLGVAVGRIGDILIADHLGPPTSMPFGFRCPENVDVGVTVGSPCPPGQVVHLTAAYYLLASLAIFAIVLWARPRLRAVRGQAALLVAVLYGTNRFLLDFVRADDRRLGFTGSQWTAVTAVVVGSTLMIWRRRTVTRRQARQPSDITNGSAPATPPDRPRPLSPTPEEED